MSWQNYLDPWEHRCSLRVFIEHWASYVWAGTRVQAQTAFSPAVDNLILPSLDTSFPYGDRPRSVPTCSYYKVVTFLNKAFVGMLLFLLSIPGVEIWSHRVDECLTLQETDKRISKVSVLFILPQQWDSCLLRILATTSCC